METNTFMKDNHLSLTKRSCSCNMEGINNQTKKNKPPNVVSMARKEDLVHFPHLASTHSPFYTNHFFKRKKNCVVSLYFDTSRCETLVLKRSHVFYSLNFFLVFPLS